MSESIRLRIDRTIQSEYDKMTDMDIAAKVPDHVTLSRVTIDGEPFFKIAHSDAMRPFFMSIVSPSNHWMFISSNGGLTAGRKNAEYALFPYYSDDKVTASAEQTGSKTILWVNKNGTPTRWEPFSARCPGDQRISRNLYKHVYGHKILFEEVHHDLELAFQYQWCSGNTFGFVRQSKLTNLGNRDVTIRILDGIQNIMPAGVPSDLQQRFSNLIDAYKRSERAGETGMGIYALSAILSDKAEPSEALKANIAWSSGIEDAVYLLSSLQLDTFRKGQPIKPETDVKGEKGAFFMHAEMHIPADGEKQWMIAADVNKSHSEVIGIMDLIRQSGSIQQLVNQDIDKGTHDLVTLAASADALQETADPYRDARHFSNVLFNIMRGGIFDDNYNIEIPDFTTYLANANRHVYASVKSRLEALPEIISLQQLREFAQNQNDPDLSRLAFEYLPLKFSRRHGDPSRPWNRFSINTRSEVDGSKILDYEGNWRDIFQNWEALALAFPAFTEGMIHKFLNATTFDGYNPYRVTKDGFDWETIEPDDPWSYIGYWGDHQIIYLLKLLELCEKHDPGKLENDFDHDLFVYANVPYKIRAYSDILKNPKDTVDFDHTLDRQLRQQKEAEGADAALLRDAQGRIYKVNFLEKILASVLAKLSNFIPEGGIWMNTQRPEWNDANNALVGNGVSVVTLCYMRRFFRFFKTLLHNSASRSVRISTALHGFFERIVDALEQYHALLPGKISHSDRKRILDLLGQAGSDYRTQIYAHAFSGEKEVLSFKKLEYFIDLGLDCIDHSIKANKRHDHLFHAYNLMTIGDDNTISISRLSEMLEGQVAVLSSGYLSSEEALMVLESMKNSRLFREDQSSYLLYPNKDLPGFLEKNKIPPAQVVASPLLIKLIREGNKDIVEQDSRGDYHFNGNFRNAGDLKQALEKLPDSLVTKRMKKEKRRVLQIYEDVFNHKAFTGRSGTFYGYEGLGSIYWHMVSKLLLAVQECCQQAIEENTSPEVVRKLLQHYDEINEGIGVHKSPSRYGAFPTDPYSHTPAGKGAQQPGMTGQVKEDILCRFGEFGVSVQDGTLGFDPEILKKEAFLTRTETLTCINVQKEEEEIVLERGSLCFTYCQVPVIYKLAERNSLSIIDRENTITTFETMRLDKTTSAHVFGRTGHVVRIIAEVDERALRTPDRG